MERSREAGRLDDNTAGGTAVHAITPAERRAVLELFERWGDIDGGYRKTPREAAGVVRLPLHIVWSAPYEHDLTDRRWLRSAYQRVLSDGLEADVVTTACR